MPVLNVLAKDYAARGVTIWAINVGESKSAYESFIAENSYAYLSWGRDGTGEIADMYQVRGIPVTYLIDDQGVIRFAHIGYGSGMEQSLATEIESLLD